MLLWGLTSLVLAIAPLSGGDVAEEGVEYNLEYLDTEKYNYVLRIVNNTDYRLFCRLLDGEYSSTVWVEGDSASGWYIVYTDDHEVICR